MRHLAVFEIAAQHLAAERPLEPDCCLLAVDAREKVLGDTLVDRLQQLTGCEVSIAPDAPAPAYPPIRIDRARDEFGFAPGSVMESLDGLVQHAKKELVASD